MTTYTDIPILAPGEYTAMDGLPVAFSEEDLLAIEADMCAAADTSVPLNLEHGLPGGAGHLARHEDAGGDARATENPGQADNIRYDPLRRQMLADLHVHDAQLDAAVRRGRYQSRSAELLLTTSGAGGPARHPPPRSAAPPRVRLTGLALLDELTPAVPGLGGLSLSAGGAGHRARQENAGGVARATGQLTRDALRIARVISMYGGIE